MKILYILSQKPGCTGSGFYVNSMIKQAVEKNHHCHLVSGIHKDDSIYLDHLNEKDCSFLMFETDDLPFPLPGMSDVMPYKSTCFKDMTDKELNLYEASFKEKIYKSVNKFKPDVIHSNHLWLVSSFAKEVCPDIPMIVSCHGTDLRQLKQCPDLSEKVLRGCKKAEKIIALSKAQKKEITALYGIPESKIEVAGTGFNDALFYPVKKEKTPPVKLLYAGKISFAKGVDWLLDAISLALSRCNSDIKLTIAGSGSGEEYEICMEKIEKLKDNVSFAGMLSQEELAEKMRESHIFILPSFYEGLPLVLFEALASGCKVITTKLPGTLEITGNEESDTIRFIDLPELETIDRPYKKDMPHLKEKLAKIIIEETDKILSKGEEDLSINESLLKNYTWKEIFSKVESMFGEIKK